MQKSSKLWFRVKCAGASLVMGTFPDGFQPYDQVSQLYDLRAVADLFGL